MSVANIVEDIRDLHNRGCYLQREEVAALVRYIDTLEWRRIDDVWLALERFEQVLASERDQHQLEMVELRDILEDKNGQ